MMGAGTWELRPGLLRRSRVLHDTLPLGARLTLLYGQLVWSCGDKLHRVVHSLPSSLRVRLTLDG